MNAKLNFILPKESKDLELALKGPYLANALIAIDERFRRMIKYEELQTIELEKVREIIRESLADNFIDLEDLY